MAKRGNNKFLKEFEESLERPARWRGYKQYFLIVCEDESTEPAYFEQFKKAFDEISEETLFLKHIGTGRDPQGVVNQTVIEREILKSESLKEVDFVWVVFDKDDADENETKIKKFNSAFEIAKQENINVAYSNEVFELWLLLHLINVSGANPIPRAEIYEKLESTIKNAGQKYQDFVYEHGKANIIAIVAQIGNEEQAIAKAEKLLAQQKDKKPIEANPSTKVHLLVKELRAWLNFYKGE